MTQPLYKFGDKVRSKSGLIFVIDIISWNPDMPDRGYNYSSARENYLFAEKDLEPVKEPLTATFECSWTVGFDGTEEHYYSEDIADVLKPFVGKRTRVQITELL